MNKISRVYISGLGAVGSVYAAKIHRMSPESLSVILDEERIKRYSAGSVTVNGETIPFSYISPDSDTPHADLIIIAVKQQNLHESIRDIKKFVKDDTIILSLLNGIISEEMIGAVYGMKKVLRAFVVGTDAVREGTDVIYNSPGKIVFGADRDSVNDARVNAVKDLFARAGISFTIPEDIIREQWWKFMMNVGINQVSAILRAPYGVFQRVSEAQELMAAASMEVITIAEKKGISLNNDDIERYAGIINTLSPEGKTSMLQDVEAGRKTEVDIFAGTVIEMGKKFGVPTPVNDMLFRMIKTIEQMY